MTPPTLEDRLATVERHSYTINALAEVLEAVSSYAHLTDRSDLGFLIGFLGDRLREESDTVIAAAATMAARPSARGKK